MARMSLEMSPLSSRKPIVSAYMAEIMDNPRLAPFISHHRLIPSAEALHAESRLPWSPAISRLLSQKGISLYSHQALAADHIRAGHSIVAATPTASGKSLIYNLPVLDGYLKDPDAKALYLFPLKALAQDQLSSFNDLCAAWPAEARPEAAIYDGDTTDYMRRKIRANPPAALITNPDMLHMGILPYHQNWTTFLANLNYVIVDEAHAYRGVFGSHVAQIFRRLNRLCDLYNASPTFIFCTATLGNPGELAAALMGTDRQPILIDKSGAPRGARHFLFMNPDSAASTCAIELLKQALARNLRTIVYCRSRRMTELVSIWAGSEAGPWQNRVSAYRAGYLPEQRREIEARMASGELLAVVSTSALELGMDIGGLDLCILIGYPGTIMQTLQRGGRVGRAGRESAVILVAGEDALDQYFARNPEDFFSRPPERAVINPDNEVIVGLHLECAAAEHPLSASEQWLASPGARLALENLRGRGLLLPSADGSQWLASRKRPHKDVNIRGGFQSYAIEDLDGRIIGVMDGGRAWAETHPGALYLHQGKSYIIQELDDARRRILAKPENVSWHTRVRSKKKTLILEEKNRMPVGRCAVFLGRLRIMEQITAYEKRDSSQNRVISIIPLEAPERQFETEGLWFVIPDNIRMDLEENFINFMGSIHAMEHAIIGMLPLEVMADRNDFGGISMPLHWQTGLPTVFVYDGLPGGAGLSRAAFGSARRVLSSTLKAVATCTCEDGCPSCVHSPKCGAGNRPLSKAGAIALMGKMLEDGSEGAEICRDLAIASAEEEKPAPKQLHPDPAKAPESGAPRAEPPAHYVVFDVETRRSAAEVGGWGNASQMGVSVAVLYDSSADEYFSYGEEDLECMFDRMEAASLVIGFNSIQFDYEVLSAFRDAPASKNKGLLRKLPSLDLLQRVTEKLKHRVSLDNLGKSTLNIAKSADGIQALRWWQEGEIKKIEEYCRKDVELTKDLYLFGLKQQYLLFTNKHGQKVRIDVDFSWPR